MRPARVLLPVASAFLLLPLCWASFGPAQSTFPSELIEFRMMAFKPTGLSVNLRQSVGYLSGNRALTRRVGERRPTGPESWMMNERVESVSFRITSVASREGGNELYVAGVDDEGVPLIEKWSCGVRPGGYGIQSTSGAPQPIGTPMGPYTCQEVLNGPLWAAEGKLPKMQRRQVYKGTAAGIFRRLVADPEGRYLLALSYPSGSIHRFDLSSTPVAPVLLFSTHHLPELSTMKTMTLQHHGQEGRKCVLTQVAGSLHPANEKYIVLSDVDNDGNYEVQQALTGPEWDGEGYDDYENWDEYWNCGVTIDW